MATSEVLVHYSQIVAALGKALDGKDVPKLVKELVEMEYFEGELECWADSFGEEPDAIGDKLKKVDSAESFTEWFDSLCPEFSTGGEGWGHYPDESFFEMVIGRTLEYCEVPWPRFSLVVFNKIHYCNLDHSRSFKEGHIYFAFAPDGCFTRVVTPEGKNLESLVGKELEVSTYETPEY